MATKKGVWNLQEVRDKQLQSEWSYTGETTLSLFGKNNVGQLGQNNITYYSSPIQLPGTTWDRISQSYQSNYGIKTDGTLWSWGYQIRGELGLNQQGVNISSPTQVGALTTWRWASGCKWAAAGIRYPGASGSTNGTLWTWGGDSAGSLGLNVNWEKKSSPTQIAGAFWSSVHGFSHYNFAATDTSGHLFTWGENEFGNLGTNNSSSPSNTGYSSPCQVGTDTTWGTHENLDGKVHAFQNGLQWIKTDGTLWGWGRNYYGQQGFNNESVFSSPTQLGTESTWRYISGSPSAMVATKTDGTLWGSGYNDDGTLGQNNRTKYSSPTQIGTGTDWVRPAGTGYSAGIIATKTDGSLWVWGSGYHGNLGLNSSGAPTLLSSPTQLPGSWDLDKIDPGCFSGNDAGVAAAWKIN
tara:strand:- start:80 stop:1306 length:1227 start_codon:yes stop_codon:yes gene_type:complete